MPRRPRVNTGGYAYHVLNRAAGRRTLFRTDADYLAFERIIEQVHRRVPLRLLSYCLMPNHWHLVPWPEHDGQLSEFMRLLTVTHAQRWHAHRGTAGEGPVYQGRFKSFPIEQDEHLLTVCRYAERNALRAGLVRRAQEWRWCSLAAALRADPPGWLLPHARWPVTVPAAWVRRVNRPQTEAEVEAVRQSIARGAPFGDERWTRAAARALGLESSLRPRGRPPKPKPKPKPTPKPTIR